MNDWFICTSTCLVLSLFVNNANPRFVGVYVLQFCKTSSTISIFPFQFLLVVCFLWIANAYFTKLISKWTNLQQQKWFHVESPKEDLLLRKYISTSYKYNKFQLIKSVTTSIFQFNKGRWKASTPTTTTTTTTTNDTNYFMNILYNETTTWPK